MSVPRSFKSSLFLSVPGAWAVGSEEWKMKRRPLRPAAFNASIPALTTGSRMTCGILLLENISESWDNRLGGGEGREGGRRGREERRERRERKKRGGEGGRKKRGRTE